MYILSFDVGIKHLGFAGLDERGNVFHTGVRCIPTKTNRVKDTVATLNALMSDIDVDPDIVLVEKQLHRNPTMRVVQAILQTFFVLRYPRSKVMEYSPKNKLKGEECSNYRARKKRSIELCQAHIETHGTESVRESFRAEKKKDDMADAIMQAIHYVRDRFPVSIEETNLFDDADADADADDN